MGIFDVKSLANTLANPLQLLYLLIISSLLGLLISWVYKKTHRGFSYSQSFSITVVLITVITTLIIVLIEDNIARAIGIFGAFSIIRFRTAVKDTRDTAFVFFSLAVGLGIGTASIAITLTAVLFICLLIWLLHIINFGGTRKSEFVLHFVLDTGKTTSDAFQKVFNKYLKRNSLLNVEAKEKGKHLHFTFTMDLKSGMEVDAFSKEMNGLDGVSEVQMISAKNDLEF